MILRASSFGLDHGAACHEKLWCKAKSLVYGPELCIAGRHKSDPVSVVCRAHGKDVPHGRTWVSLQKKGVSLLCHVGGWNTHTFSSRTDPLFPTHCMSDLGASIAWEKMVDMFKDILLSWFHTRSKELVRT